MAAVPGVDVILVGPQDLSISLGIPGQTTHPPRIKHIARLAWRTLPYAFARAGREMHGAVRFELDTSIGEVWAFGDDDAATILRGPVHELLEVAAQRADAADTSLTAEGPDAADVLALVRTFA